MKFPMIRLVLAVCLALFSVHCHQTETKVVKQNNGPSGPAASAGELTPGDERPKGDGQSSGGGSYSIESGDYILDRAIEDLTLRLRDIGRPLIADWPEGWDLERLIAVIKNTKRSYRKTDPRGEDYKDDLMFNYVDDPEVLKGEEPYIEAVATFYITYASTNVHTMEAWEFYKTVNHVRMKLLHEASHLLGVGRSKDTDDRSREFAIALLINLGRLPMTCESLEPIDQSVPWVRFHNNLVEDTLCTEDIGVKSGWDNVENPSLFVGSDKSYREIFGNAELEKIQLYEQPFAINFDPASGRSEFLSSYTYRQSGKLELSEYDDFDRIEVLNLEMAHGDGPMSDLFAYEPKMADRFGHSRSFWESLSGPVPYELEEHISGEDYSEAGLWPAFVRDTLAFQRVSFDSDSSDVVYRAGLDSGLKLAARYRSYFRQPSEDGYHTYYEVSGIQMVRVDELSETLSYNSKSHRARIHIDQQLTVFCGESERLVELEYDLNLKCGAKSIVPVSVTDYVSEVAR
ncbi:MAG: hypothetical protein AAF202_02515 [Pseudomonadota bacterium]